MPGNTYSGAGVDTQGALDALRGLLGPLRRTLSQRTAEGRPMLPFGLFANVLDLGNGLGLAVSMDGVGTKALIAQMVDKYDTIGIDCIAMNVNDIICVGAEPLAMLDYIAVQAPDASVFEAVGAGLEAGANEARITIPGGEVAQISDMLLGHRDGTGFDLVGCAVGTVPTERIIVGQRIEEGDVVVGLRSSGIHSNGLSLARRVLFADAELRVTTHVAELGTTLGEELLKPTRIYVRPTMAMLAAGLDVKSLAHITSDGLLNLARIESEFGFIIDALPEPQPIFNLIQRSGDVSDEEMYQVYNMGVGFCVVVAPKDAEAVIAIAKEHEIDAMVLGHAVPDPQRRVHLKPLGLVGEGSAFSRA